MEERDVQRLIAEYPWLLDFNYESIPELGNKGMEHRTPNRSRVDLVLRHRISKRPVIVEFKAVPYIRENIGQIIEYKSQCIAEIVENRSTLSKVFGAYLSSPILVLVVPKCSQEARIACNLSGIDIYEYESAIKRLLDPSKKVELDKMAESLDKSILPASLDRNERIEEIDSKILSVMAKLGVSDRFVEFKYPKGIYYWTLANFFINRWLFYGLTISMGIFEDIFSGKYDKIAIDYFSEDKGELEKFRKQLLASGQISKVPSVKQAGESSEYVMTFYENKKAFIEDDSILETYLKVYVRIMKAELDQSAI